MSEMNEYTPELFELVDENGNKKNFDYLWELEPEFMAMPSKYRFRNNFCPSINVIRNYQLVSGNFYPRRVSFGHHVSITDNNYIKVANMIKKSKYKLLCINDNADIQNFELVVKTINDAFESKLGKKSSFEK